MNLKDIRKVHILGACGTLMGAFAVFLKQRGVDVTGSDAGIYPPMSDVLEAAGVKLFDGYSAENISSLSGVDVFIIGNVIRRDNPEAQAVLSSGATYMSLPEFMEKVLLPERTNLVVSGTHGKTTTSSLLTHVLIEAGLAPSYFLGGVAPGLKRSFEVQDRVDGYFVLEGDEYDTAFWDKVPKFTHYLPDHVILTSVEYDHADIYPSFESVIRVFEQLARMIRAGGHLIACMDYPIMKRVIESATVPVLTYGSHSITGARYVPSDIRVEPDGTRFKILDSGRQIAECKVGLFGNYNVLNALAVWIECARIGIDSEVVSRALASFGGVKRRQEVRGEFRGITVVDDFAHHPTAVRETLSGLKERFSGRRLVAVFEPRSATSRRKVFQREYEKAFRLADEVWISEPYDTSRINEGDRFSSEELVSSLKKTEKEAHVFSSVDEGVISLKASLKSGDVVAVLSNGGFGGFIPKLMNLLSQP